MITVTSPNYELKPIAGYDLADVSAVGCFVCLEYEPQAGLPHLSVLYNQDGRELFRIQTHPVAAQFSIWQRFWAAVKACFRDDDASAEVLC